MNFLKHLTPSWITKLGEKKLPSNNSKFIVSYKNTVIGNLYRDEDDFYVFEYSDKFKKQKEYKPLTSFPDKNNIYKSKYLFPFFVGRIPNPNRPIIKEILEKENIDKDDPLNILERFGKKTLNNPFIVEKELTT